MIILIKFHFFYSFLSALLAYSLDFLGKTSVLNLRGNPRSMNGKIWYDFFEQTSLEFS